MKKGFIAITAVFVIGMSGLALAQMDDKGNGMTNKDNKGSMMGGGMMDKGMMMQMHGMMMKMGAMMNKTAFATTDGGFVVVSADKITKYDKDINVVKEVELKNDMDAMQKMMGEMMEKCSMMGNGKGKDKVDDDDADKAVDIDALDDEDDEGETDEEA